MNKSNESQKKQKVPSLLQLLTPCVTPISHRHDSLVAKKIVAVLTSENFAIEEFHKHNSYIDDCEIIVDKILE